MPTACAPRGIRGRPRHADPRPAAGRSAPVATGRPARTPRPAPPPSRAAARCGSGRTAPRDVAGQGAEGDRRVGQAEGGQPDLRQRPAPARRRHRQRRSCRWSCPGRSPCRWWCSASHARSSGSPRAPPAPDRPAVTSFWKSTKAFLPRWRRRRWRGWRAVLSAGWRNGVSPTPAAAPSAKASARSKVPLQAPALACARAIRRAGRHPPRHPSAACHAPGRTTARSASSRRP